MSHFSFLAWPTVDQAATVLSLHTILGHNISQVYRGAVTCIKSVSHPDTARFYSLSKAASRMNLD